jgi:hypothetical protein
MVAGDDKNLGCLSQDNAVPLIIQYSYSGQVGENAKVLNQKFFSSVFFKQDGQIEQPAKVRGLKYQNPDNVRSPDIKYIVGVFNTYNSENQFA